MPLALAGISSNAVVAAAADKRDGVQIALPTPLAASN
jgi:hypothetical protein